MAKQDDANFGKLATLGLEVAAGAGLGALIGHWIDRKWNSDPWGVMIGTLLGCAAGVYLLIKGAINADRR
jgi:F0F1-type ATP synthase assembly protein I